MAQRHEYSEMVREALDAAGWFPGRVMPAQAREWIRELDRPDGFQVFAAAERVLTEFGGLHIRAMGPGVEAARMSIEVDPTLAFGEEDRFEACAMRLNRRLYPLGEVEGGHAFVAIAEDGRVYLLMDEPLAVVGSFDEALAALVEGRRWREVT